jgi:hypothetical protein
MCTGWRMRSDPPGGTSPGSPCVAGNRGSLRKLGLRVTSLASAAGYHLPSSPALVQHEPGGQAHVAGHIAMVARVPLSQRRCDRGRRRNRVPGRQARTVRPPDDGGRATSSCPGTPPAGWPIPVKRRVGCFGSSAARCGHRFAEAECRAPRKRPIGCLSLPPLVRAVVRMYCRARDLELPRSWVQPGPTARDE